MYIDPDAPDNLWWFGTDSPDPNDPSNARLNFFTWGTMNERRYKIIKRKSNPLLDYQKMVEALMKGTTAWNDWQKENPSIDFYDFECLDFPCKINLEGAIFSKPVNFRRIKFKGANFRKVKFEKKVSFSQATFDGEVDFEKARFATQATDAAQAFFLNTTFDGNVNFIEANFYKGAYFKKARFTKEANFENVIFYKDGNFMSATFTEGANFERVIFDKNSNFALTTFNNEANFGGVRFLKKAIFWRTTFASQAYFSGATFAKYANFNRTAFQSSSFFNQARFGGNVINFSHMILSADSNLLFEDAEFKNAIPDFRYLNRIPDIRFHGFSLPAPNKLIKKWNKGNEDRYRKLKELAIGNHNHEYELKFYGYEMNSKLISFNATYELQIYSYKMNNKLRHFCIIIKNFFNKKWWIDSKKNLWKFYNEKWQEFCKAIGKSFVNKNIWKFFNERWWGFYRAIEKIFFNTKWQMDIVPTYLYRFFSNYGQSIGKPIFWLVVLLGVHYICKLDFNWSTIFKTISPLPLSANDIGEGKSIGKVGLTIKIFATFFWFLFFLAMRNKFKIK